jgi:GTPase SAR1 family protein
MEMDVKYLFENGNYIGSVPYKIGVIGDGSVGKSALVLNLANLKEFSSMVDIERSTFGYLQFDTLLYKEPQNNKIIPITFVDIEGATDTDKCLSIGNYIALIEKANCDMYIIVFDKPFHEHNRFCQKYIEKNLGRKCLLVRSKADLLFRESFQEKTEGEKEKSNERAYRMKIALNKVKKYALKMSTDERLTKKVFLTAAVCNVHWIDGSFATFDLDELKKQIVQFAVTDLRVERIYALAVRSAIAVINTCFRRGYTVSKRKYTWCAAVASTIPFLDEIPAFFGREKIRETIGVHDKTKVHRTKDAFEEYLMTKNIIIPKDELKSGYFEYLKPNKKNQTANSEAQPPTNVQQQLIHNVENNSCTFHKIQICAGHAIGSVVKPTVTGLGIAGKMIDDAARLVVPATSATLRSISMAGIIVGAVLTPVFAAWSFYSTGQRMDEHLHLLCDDLIIISKYFAINLCSEYCKNINQPVSASAENNISSSDDDSSTCDE